MHQQNEDPNDLGSPTGGFFNPKRRLEKLTASPPKRNREYNKDEELKNLLREKISPSDLFPFFVLSHEEIAKLLEVKRSIIPAFLSSAKAKTESGNVWSSFPSWPYPQLIRYKKLSPVMKFFREGGFNFKQLILNRENPIVAHFKLTEEQVASINEKIKNVFGDENSFNEMLADSNENEEDWLKKNILPSHLFPFFVLSYEEIAKLLGLANYKIYNFLHLPLQNDESSNICSKFPRWPYQQLVERNNPSPVMKFFREGGFNFKQLILNRENPIVAHFKLTEKQVDSINEKIKSVFGDENNFNEMLRKSVADSDKRELEASELLGSKRALGHSVFSEPKKNRTTAKDRNLKKWFEENVILEDLVPFFSLSAKEMCNFLGRSNNVLPAWINALKIKNPTIWGDFPCWLYEGLNSTDKYTKNKTIKTWIDFFRNHKINSHHFNLDPNNSIALYLELTEEEAHFIEEKRKKIFSGKTYFNRRLQSDLPEFFSAPLEANSDSCPDDDKREEAELLHSKRIDLNNLVAEAETESEHEESEAAASMRMLRYG